MRPRRLLLVDGDPDFRRSLATELQLRDVFLIDEADNGGKALDAASLHPYDAVLSEVRLPDIDGREICRALRRRGVDIPFIMLTAAASGFDHILALESGANDYVTKPPNFSVLFARLCARIREYERSMDARFIVGPYVFLPGSGLLINRSTQEKITLTISEVKILRRLYLAGGSVVEKDQLVGDTWHNDGRAGVYEKHIYEKHIYTLRRKLEKDPHKPVLLFTERNGYRLAL